ncbi:MAG: hypothetical protein LBV36_09090 [Chromatiales bacterium]|jgi:multidrug efflux pump subunit AcrA (membrane-fusion protein)|nr:hypothetical protein [Chromatiales bacterium]
MRPEQVADAQFLEAERLLSGQLGEYRAKLGRIDAEIARREAELRSTLELVRKLEQTVPIATQRAQDFKDLVDHSFVSKHGYLEQEQTRIEQEADLANQRSRLEEIAAALREGRGQREELTAETRRIALDMDSRFALLRPTFSLSTLGFTSFSPTYNYIRTYQAGHGGLRIWLRLRWPVPDGQRWWSLGRFALGDGTTCRVRQLLAAVARTHA